MTSMILKDIYDKDITRHINPAVVVNDHALETINAEIEEYVFTDELREKLFDFLHTLLNKKSGKTGIWINGYYGSGKSHFIKYIHYCLNPDTREKAFEHYLKAVRKSESGLSEVTESNILLMKKKIEQEGVENILFNVEDVTGDGKANTRLTRIFLNMLNRHRGYNSTNIILALHFEKYLDRKGIFELFKQKLFDEEGFTWKDDCNRLASSSLRMIVDLAGSIDPSLDTESMYNTLNNQEKIEITIEATLIPEIIDYLQILPGNARLVFLVDEISQYIGKNREMLLNFQSIVERMSTDCKGKAWVACTAQQSLDELAGNISDLDVKDEFGKILGRFDTRISLESTDAAYITQRRVLEKNSRGIDVLQKMFKEKRDAIEMQFKTNHDLFRGFEGEDDFYLSYPFVPYQFRLISHVFDAFQNLNYVIREVKDNERSVLGITHYTARENATRELGYFMPFDAFYNHQFSSNMQNRGRKAIEPAMSLSFVKRDPFAQRVVKALFMVSNLSDPIRQTFPANIDNLALLMMDRLDQNKLDLQHKIKDVLDHLLDESVIREEKGSYFFFKEDEIEVTNEINNTVVNSEDRLQEFFDLISPMFNVNQKVRMQNTDFSVGYNVDDKQFIRGNHAGITFVVFETRDADQIRLANPDNRLLACINEWLGKEEALRKDFTRYLKTVKYLKSHSDGAMGQRMETLNNFRTRNNRLKDKIKANFQKHLPVTRYVSGQSIIDASDISGSTPAERHRNAVEKHLSRIFRHMKLADSYAATNQELRDKLKGPQQKSFDNTLSQAEEMVENEILNLGNEATVADLVNKFSQPPFGWKDVAVIDILTCLNFKRKRSLEFKNNSLSPLEFADKAFSNAERGSCVVRSLSGPGQEEINQAIKDFREIFNENIREDTDFEKVIAAMKQKMDSFKGNFASLENDYYGKFPPGIHMHTVNDKLRNIVEIRNPEIFFSTLKKEVPELKLCYETAKTMEGWLDRSAKEYKQSMDFIRHNASNFHSLENGCEEKARILTDFLEDTVPWENFRPVLKAIEEFKTVLKERMNSLRQETLNKYKAIYDELEKKCEAENLAEDPAYYAPRKEILARIEKQESITELENTLYKADKFYDDAWQKLAEASNRKKAEEGKKVKPTVSFKPVNGRKLELKSEEDVEIFIEEEKKALLKLISENKIVVIN